MDPNKMTWLRTQESASAKLYQHDNKHSSKLVMVPMTANKPHPTCKSSGWSFWLWCALLWCISHCIKNAWLDTYSHTWFAVSIQEEVLQYFNDYNMISIMLMSYHAVIPMIIWNRSATREMINITLWILGPHNSFAALLIILSINRAFVIPFLSVLLAGG